MELTEAFKIQYDMLVQQQALSECAILSNTIQLEQAKIERALQITNAITSLAEAAIINENGDESKIDELLRKVQDIAKTVTTYQPARPNLTSSEVIDVTDKTYEPLSIKQSIKVGDVNGPIEKIKFLLGRVVDWLKRIVLYAFNKCKAIIYTIVGRKDEASKMLDKLSNSDLKFRLEKLKRIETGFIKQIKPNAKNTPVRIVEVKPDVIAQNPVLFRPLAESYLNEADDNNDTNNNTKPVTRKVIELDVSEDLYALQTALHHFFDTFDTAFGSYGEYLFDTGDILVVFKFIEQIVKGLESAKVNPAIIQSQMTNISADAINANRQRTKANIDVLNAAAYDTAMTIEKINKIITSKQLVSLTTYGVSHIFLNRYTYSALADIVDNIDSRLREANNLQKNLEKAKANFETLIKRIEVLRNSLKGYGYMSVTSIYERMVDELYQSTMYMTQITTMRLNALIKYLQQIQQIRITVAALVNMSNLEKAKININTLM